MGDLLQNEMFEKITYEMIYNKSTNYRWWIQPNYDCCKDFVNHDDPRKQALEIYRTLTPRTRKKAIDTQFWGWMKRLAMPNADPTTGETLS